MVVTWSLLNEILQFKCLHVHTSDYYLVPEFSTTRATAQTLQNWNFMNKQVGKCKTHAFFVLYSSFLNENAPIIYRWKAVANTYVVVEKSARKAPWFESYKP